MARSGWSYEPAKGSQITYNLAEMSIEDLMNIQVTLASKNPQKYFDTPAAIYVITNEDIKRSGATNIPDLLRMAPGMEVARIDSGRWAVGIRGLSSELSRYMLVLVDGRSVYNPIFAGVFWIGVDYPLEDIERIEIIRGPGGALWGANAVNGIVNIITKNAKDTQGGLVTIGGGTLEKGFGTVRYGGTVNEKLKYRVYAKYFNRDTLDNNYDGAQMGQAGFSTSWDSEGGNSFRFQGDIYDGNAGQKAVKDIDSSGGNLLGRWQKKLNNASDVMLQIYYNHLYHHDYKVKAAVDTLDLDFQHNFAWTSRQKITWGLGYRLNYIDTRGTPDLEFDPARHSDNLFSAFVQDEITLVKDMLNLTLGSKFEHNDYSGYEIQPSAKILYKPTPHQSLWASVSRAVRTPTPLDQDMRLSLDLGPLPPGWGGYVKGSKEFKSEGLLAYEIGYRIKPITRLVVDMVAYYNVYDNLWSSEVDASGFPPLLFVNEKNEHSGRIMGGEFAVDYSPFDWWKLHASHSIMEIDIERDGPNVEPTGKDEMEKRSPRHQSSLRSYMDLPGNASLDCIFRYVSELSHLHIDSYYNLDVRLAWKVRPNIELSVVGQNLLDNEHAENSVDNKIPRGFYGKMQWQW